MTFDRLRRRGGQARPVVNAWRKSCPPSRGWRVDVAPRRQARHTDRKWHAGLRGRRARRASRQEKVLPMCWPPWLAADARPNASMQAIAEAFHCRRPVCGRERAFQVGHQVERRLLRDHGNCDRRADVLLDPLSVAARQAERIGAQDRCCCWLPGSGRRPCPSAGVRSPGSAGCAGAEGGPTPVKSGLFCCSECLRSR